MLTYANHLDLLLKWRSLLPAAVHQTGHTSPIILLGWPMGKAKQDRHGKSTALVAKHARKL
jgi:hypothetical protein